jgi:ABC-type sugar transport system ATPase subunit
MKKTGRAMSGNGVLLKMKNIHKQFPGVYALKGVDFDLRAGEIHALLGENGAGKSTLIKILGGIYPKDEGLVEIDGLPVIIDSVANARRAGVRIIHQELVLVPSLSIAENVFLGNAPVKRGFVDFAYIRKETQKMLDSFGIRHRADENVSGLTVAEQQLVEIVKAISFNAKIIVMDEPTSSLSDRECDALFDKMKALKERGIGIIYISHRMAELNIVADRVTVLRDGNYIGTRAMKETSTDELITMMVGREISNYYQRDYCSSDEVVLEVKNLYTDYIEDVSFTVKRGEILGFSGLMGAGRTETMRAIFGIDKIRSGKIFLEGREIAIRSVADAMRYGISLVPEDRKLNGIIPQESIMFNLSLKVLFEFIRGIFVDEKKEYNITMRYFDELAVKAPSIQGLVGNLSGGNQQKVVVASWLATNPKVLIFDEPTRGIDIGAKTEIYAIMNKLARAGIAIIMVSSEMPEILNMSDRIAVMRGRRLSGVLGREEADQEAIMQMAVLI